MANPTKRWQQRYFEYYYHNKKHWINGTQRFYNLILKHLPKDKHILELGPGPQNETSTFLCSNFASLGGVDVDEEATQNPALRHLHLCEGNAWPITDDSYDAVVADYVLEHVARPKDTVVEALRVLRPGGLFFFRTPNIWHYVGMVAAFTPHWFHELVARRLNPGPPGTHDPWPTHYRMNSRGRLRRLMSNAGFREVELSMIEPEPSYGQASRVLFFLFMGYERLVNSSNRLSGFRGNILGAFVKPQT